MRKVLVLSVLGLILVAAEASAQSRHPYGSGLGGGYGSGYGSGTGSNPNSHWNGGYTTPRGTYVEPYRQTNPNGSTLDNYGTRPNYNPYSGQSGTRRGRY